VRLPRLCVDPRKKQLGPQLAASFSCQQMPLADAAKAMAALKKRP
jgi:hypothetical protein